jgi:ubiquinol-cytochrome c reductase cytochrome b subunit
LQYFPGESEAWGAIYIPGLIMLILALMPIVGRWKLGHRFNVAFLFALIAGAGMLTYLAWHADYRGPAAADFAKAAEETEQEAHRAVELALAPTGIPPTGALTLLRTDPKTQGHRDFVSQCAICHGKPEEKDDKGNPLRDGAPALTGFAGREWIKGLLDPKQVATAAYFGNTAHFEGDMVNFVQNDLAEWTPEEITDAINALSAEAKLPSQQAADQADAASIERGRALLKDEERCAGCHKFHEVGELGTAPDLTGYGGEAWLTEFIANPAHERFYGDNNDRMPAFAPEPGAASNQLSPEQLKLMVDYLRGNWYTSP